MVTHDGENIECMMWNTETPISKLELGVIVQYECFVIEEAQFFANLKNLCYSLLFFHKKNILVVGLDGCAEQKKFGEILDVIPFSTSVIKLTALCCFCKDGTLAPYTKKLGTRSEEQVDVGGAEKYVAVCLRHL